MNSFEEGLRLISEKADMIQDAKDGMQLLTIEITKFCPVKIGERHTITRDKGGYYTPHAGKTFIVDAIRFQKDWTGEGFTISGYIIKADGSVGKARGGVFIRMNQKKGSAK